MNPGAGPQQPGSQLPATSPVPEAPKGVQFASTPQLNELVLNPPSLQEKLNAIEELALRNDLDPNTFETLRQNAAIDTASLTGAERNDAVDSKRAALLALSLQNQRLGAQVPLANLPGFNEIQAAALNPNESPEIRKTALQGLRILNRPQDPMVRKIAKAASRSKDPQMKQMAKSLLEGRPFEFTAA